MAEKPPVVSNTTPLINLSGVGLLDLLPALYQSVIIAEAVLAEFEAKARPDDPDLRLAGWLTVVPVATCWMASPITAPLTSGLTSGYRATILSAPASPFAAAFPQAQLGGHRASFPGRGRGRWRRRQRDRPGNEPGTMGEYAGGERAGGTAPRAEERCADCLHWRMGCSFAMSPSCWIITIRRR